MTQKISSKNTALNQVASTFKAKRYAELFTDAIVLDYGCGKGMSRMYCLNTLQVSKWYGYDKYHEPYTDLETTSEFIRAVQDGNKKAVITGQYRKDKNSPEPKTDFEIKNKKNGIYRNRNNTK